MNLRLRGNSLRLRLTKSEVAEISTGGAIEEKIEFAAEPSQHLVYAVEAKNDAEKPTVVFDAGRITVFIPEAQARKRAQTDQIGIEAEKRLGDGRSAF